MLNFLIFSTSFLMFTVTFMNNNGIEMLLGHPIGKNRVWVELKYESRKEIKEYVLFQPIKSFNLVEWVKSF